jgi:hypothetical protein
MASASSPDERRMEERRASERRASVETLSMAPAAEEGWQCSTELIGCALETADGAAGLVEDLLIEAESSAIAGLVVAAGFLSVEVRVVLPLGVIERIDWTARKVYLRGTREEIQVLAAGENQT